MPENWSAYELLKPLDVAPPIVFLYLMEFYNDRTAAEQRFIGRIAEETFTFLVLNVFLSTARSVPVSRLSFTRLDRHGKGYEELLRVPHGMIDPWFDYRIFSLLMLLDVESSDALLANILIYEE